MILYRRHFYDANGRLCNRGLRPWLEARGVKWSDFLAEGIEADRLRDIGAGDHRVDIVIRNAENG